MYYSHICICHGFLWTVSQCPGGGRWGVLPHLRQECECRAVEARMLLTTASIRSSCSLPSERSGAEERTRKGRESARASVAERGHSHSRAGVREERRATDLVPALLAAAVVAWRRSSSGQLIGIGSSTRRVRCGAGGRTVVRVHARASSSRDGECRLRCTWWHSACWGGVLEGVQGTGSCVAGHRALHHSIVPAPAVRGWSSHGSDCKKKKKLSRWHCLKVVRGRRCNEGRLLRDIKRVARVVL